MYHFQYVAKKELKPAKKQLMELIHKVQDEVRDNFTFQYEFVGSVKGNMVTWDVKSNVGFDFDVNIRVNDDDEEFEAKDIKKIFSHFCTAYPDRVFLCFYHTVCHGRISVLLQI